LAASSPKRTRNKN